MNAVILAGGRSPRLREERMAGGRPTRGQPHGKQTSGGPYGEVTAPVADHARIAQRAGG